jgi:translocation and assembly module TamB
VRPLHRRLLVSLLLLGAIAAAGGVVLYSERLPGWGFALLQGSLPGELSAEALTGRLAGPLTIRGLRYRSEGVNLSLAALHLDWQPAALLYNTLRIATLRLQGVVVELPVTQQDEGKGAPPFTLPPLWLPFAVELDALQLEQLAIVRAGGKPVTLDRVTLAASLRWHTLRLQPLRLHSRELGLEGEVTGELALRDQLPLDLQLQWRWQPAVAEPIADAPSGAPSGPPFAVPPLAATGTLSGDLAVLQLHQRLSSPVAAELDVTLSSPLRAPHWQARLSLPALNSAQLTSLLPMVTTPFALRDLLLEARGDLDALRFEGGAVATLEASGEVALQLGGSVDATSLELTRLHLTLPGAAGEVDGRGRLTFADQSYLWHGAWREVGWPLRGERQWASERGAITLTGEGSNYRLSLDTGVEPVGLPASHWRVAASGDPQGVTLQGINATLLDGTLQGTMRVDWSTQPVSPPVSQIAWQGAFEASGLDPATVGPAWAAWPGAVDLAGDFRGSLNGDDLTTLTLEGQIASLGGRLRGLALGGGARARWHREALTVNTRQLSWGSATASLAGRAGTSLDIKGELAVGDLAQLLPPGSGSMQGTVAISGARAAPLLRLSLNGKGLGWQAYRTERATLKGTLDLADATPSSLALRLEGVRQDALPLGLITLHGKGRLASHRLTLALDDTAQQRGAEVALEGGYGDARWQGRIEQVTLRPYAESRWQLAAPAPLDLSLSQASLAALCLQEREARLCLEGGWQEATGLQATIALQALPLSQITALLLPRLTARGVLGGSATLQLKPGERLALDGDFALREGRLILYEADGKTEQRVLPLQVATLHLATDAATIDGAAKAANGSADEGLLRAEARLALGATDHLDASLQLPLQRGWLRAAAEQPLQGALTVALQDLTLIELLQPEIRDPQGELQLALQLGGTLARPEPAGQLQLIDGRCAIPRLGLQLDGLELTAETRNSEQLRIAAAARSGGGTLGATGAWQREAGGGWSLDLQIDGERFEVARIPEARVKVSPQLTVHVEPLLVRIDGRLAIPEARLEPRDTSRAVRVSKDVVMVDDAHSDAQSERWRIYTHLELEAPDSIRFIGYGFDGRIGGRLLLVDEPQRLTRGRGELHVVTGSRYTALGQELQTPRGRLIFADSPVDNPGLDIVAQREVGDVVAGVRVGGTARDPQLTLFSQPSMDEADILAYLTLGRPLSSAGQADGQTMMRAANTAGLTGGDYIAGYVGRQFGLEEARLQSEGETEQPWLVIGKYLSPRLYIRYGTALLESGNSVLVRYRLSDGWFLEGESGTSRSGGDIFYTFERP